MKKVTLILPDKITKIGGTSRTVLLTSNLYFALPLRQKEKITTKWPLCGRSKIKDKIEVRSEKLEVRSRKYKIQSTK